MVPLNADRYVLALEEIDRTQISVVGGKGAHLGELARIEGIHVPAGFCVTTDAFQRIMADAPLLDDQVDRLTRLERLHVRSNRLTAVPRKPPPPCGPTTPNGRASMSTIRKPGSTPRSVESKVAANNSTSSMQPCTTSRARARASAIPW